MKLEKLPSNFIRDFQIWFRERLEGSGNDGTYANLILSVLTVNPDFIEDGQDALDGSNNSRDVANQAAPNPNWKNSKNFIDQKRLEIERAIVIVEEKLRMKGDGSGGGGPRGGRGIRPNNMDHQPVNDKSYLDMVPDEFKNNIAIKCIKAAAEQDMGIEDLLNEICIQMKNSKADSESPLVEGNICFHLPSSHSSSDVDDEVDLDDATLPSLNAGSDATPPASEGKDFVDSIKQDGSQSSDDESGHSDNKPSAFSPCLKNDESRNYSSFFANKASDACSFAKYILPLLAVANEEPVRNLEGQAFGNEELSLRNSKLDVILSEKVSTDSDYPGKIEKFVDNPITTLEKLHESYLNDELRWIDPFSSTLQFYSNKFTLGAIDNLQQAGNDDEKTEVPSDDEQPIGDSACPKESLTKPTTEEEVSTEESSSKSTPISSPTDSDETSDADEVAGLFHLPMEEFMEIMANETNQTDLADDSSGAAKEECQHGLGNPISQYWIGAAGSLLPAPLFQDGFQKTASWVSKQNSRNSLKYQGLNHDEDSSFTPYVPQPKGFGSFFGLENFTNRAPKFETVVATEDPTKCEDLLHSEATHFAPIKPKSSRDSDGNIDTKACITALEQSATNIKAKKKVVDGTQTRTPAIARENLLSSPLSVLEIERSNLMDTQLKEELKEIQSGYKSETTVDRETTVEEQTTYSFPGYRNNLEPLDTITELEVGACAIAEKEENLNSFQRDTRIWGSGYINSADTGNVKGASSPDWRNKKDLTIVSASAFGINVNFRQPSWSTSDDTEETDFNNATAFNEGFIPKNELLISPEVDAETKDGNNNDTVVAEEKVEDKVEETNQNTTSFDDEEVFEILRIPADLPAELEGYSDGSAELTLDYTVDNELPAIPTNNALYSSELEDEWHRLSQPFDIQVPRKSAHFKLGDDWHSPHRRPCSFYLEGNCRRSDCKFSHDLSTITCRFWEEGSCFKGVTCPFLHGYSSHQDRLSPLSFSPPISEEILSRSKVLSSPLPPKWNFKLESEKDFPSLSASSLKETELHSNSLPLNSTTDDFNKISKRNGGGGQTRKDGGGGGGGGGFGRIIRPKKSKKSFSNQLPISSSRNEAKQQQQENLGKKNVAISVTFNTDNNSHKI